MHGRSSSTLVLATLLSLAGVQEGTPEPLGILEWPDGARRAVRLTELELAAIAAESASFLRVEGLEAPTGFGDTQAAWVTLSGDDRVRAEVLGGEGDSLELGLLGSARLEVLVDHVRSLVFQGRVSDEVRAGLAPAASGDVLYWLRAGGTLDRVPGTLIAFTDEGPRLEGAFGERLFPWSEVAALFVESLGSSPEPSRRAEEPGLRAGAVVTVDLVDGGRLGGTLVSLGAGGLELEHHPGTTVDLPLAAVGEVLAEDGRVAFLSEMEPTRVEEGSPFGDDLGLSWPHRRDASVTGGPLRAGGRTWSRGLGVHAPSRLVYTLDGGWASLRGSAALDDQVLQLSAHGSVEFRVLVDGESRWSSGVLRGGDAPVELSGIDLAGARELELVVDMADDHYVADRADWLRPLLVRAP